ncbi:MAG: hypothetical protein V7L29_16465 [Nostoc sp.]|uniref:hypothetical protein n=1 Tax=Nostoc sp. TaxID=1180 RepID=UPI002FF868C1
MGRNTKLTLEGEYLEANQTFDYRIPAVGTVLPNPNVKIPLSRFVGEPDNKVQNRRTTRFGYNFEHKFNYNLSVNNTFQLPSHVRTDAAIYYRRNNWRVGLNIKNLFDVYYFESGSRANSVFPGVLSKEVSDKLY